MMIKCNVKVKVKSGNKEYVYKGLFRTTIDAAIDAIARFENLTSVVVRPV